MSEHKIRVGTSGWHYSHWKGPFYPEEIRTAEMLDFYRDRFDTVEINNSFYRLPERRTLESWRDAVPRGFSFAVKGSRFVSHMKQLKDPGDPLATVYERIEVLDETLGPILFQLPPRWKRNLERLEAFLEALSPDHHHAFEFRDRSWLERETFELLRRHGAAHRIYDLAGFQSPKEVTADLVYVRLHGPGEKYEGSYDGRTLAGWARTFRRWSAERKQAVCYFDNDQEGHAPENASRMLEMLR